MEGWRIFENELRLKLWKLDMQIDFLLSPEAMWEFEFIELLKS
jgi:hypothetical protein